jgi:hypothetical protein
MGYKGTLRAIQAAERRQERESERRAKEQAKLSTIEQARLEVESHERELEMLVSLHKVQPDTWDWAGLAASLPPPRPKRGSYHELQAKQTVFVLQPERRRGSDAAIEQARGQDDGAFQEAMQAYAEEMVRWDKTRRLARRILARDPNAYAEALRDLNPLTDLSELRSSLDFTFHSPQLIECTIALNGDTVVPKESKTLTSTGRVSVRAMPKGRWHQIYRDYLCSLVLRVAREVFGLLPVETVLVSALVGAGPSSTAAPARSPVLSVVMHRAAFTQLVLNDLGASEALGRLGQVRANFKSSRASETFLPISPLTPADIVQTSIEDMNLDGLFAHIGALRERLRAERGRMKLAEIPLAAAGESS